MVQEKIQNKFLIPLIAASSVIRKEKVFIELLHLAKVKKVSSIKIYEVLLQSYLFAGFPSALISLKTFKEFYPSFKSNYTNKSVSELYKRGKITCKKIYGNKYDKLIENVKEFSPELSIWLVTEGYGKVLSRNQLELKEREMAIIAILTVLKFKEQLYRHITGAVRIGVKISEITDLLDTMEFLGNKLYSKFGKNVLNNFLRKKEKF